MMPLNDLGAQVQADPKAGNTLGIAGFDAIKAVEYFIDVRRIDAHALVFNRYDDFTVEDIDRHSNLLAFG